jgi:hypothetical protein
VGDDPQHTTGYEAPGIEFGLLIVPVVIIVALVASVGAAATGEWWHGVAAVLPGANAGILSWLVLWEIFGRLHPRGGNAKWFAVPLGPPLTSLAVVVAIALALQGGQPLLTLAVFGVFVVVALADVALFRRL